jgi:hypothetical protein
LRRRIDRAAIHQPAAARDAAAHAGRRPVSAVEHRLEVANAGPAIAHVDDKRLRLRIRVERENHFARTGILEGIARDFGYRACNARLIERRKTQTGRDGARPAACGDHVLFGFKPDSQYLLGCHA